MTVYTYKDLEAAGLAERWRCVNIIDNYELPVAQSAASEISYTQTVRVLEDIVNIITEAEDTAMHVALRSSVTLVAKGVPVSAAEVPMPKPATYLSDNGLWCNEPVALRDEPAFFSGEMQQYGDAREAAGYAAGVAACQDALADACCVAEIPDSKYESLMIALRGEVK